MRLNSNSITYPDKYLPEQKHGEFQAMAQGKTDYVYKAFHTESTKYGDMITIATEEAAVYVTKEQAMKFFNLKEIEV